MSIAPPASKLRVVVVTPEKAVLEVTTDSVVVTVADGELGILPGRQALVARLGAGELRLGSSEKPVRYFVEGGFVQVRNDVVTLLTTRAIPVGEIDRGKARAQLEKATNDTTLSPDERVRLADAARAMLRAVEKT